MSVSTVRDGGRVRTVRERSGVEAVKHPPIWKGVKLEVVQDNGSRNDLVWVWLGDPEYRVGLVDV